MIKIENISENNIDDVFKICSSNRSFAPMDGPIQEEAREIKRQWLINMLNHHGPCTKIAYIDEKPVAQIQFYPEETIPFNPNPRKDVVHLQCIYSPFPEAQRKGVATALMKNLVDECNSGLKCMEGRPCSFMVTKQIPYEGDSPLNEFYKKNGFKQGTQEMFLEIKVEYIPREITEYHPLPEDQGRAVILYNPYCEWGYFFAFTVKELLLEIDPVLPTEVINIWERPKLYMKRPLQRLLSGHALINSQLIRGSIFWADRRAFRREAKKALGK